MLTKTCTLTFADGATVNATVTTDAPEATRPILFTGAVDRLTEKFDEGDPAFLEVWFQNQAEELQAEFSQVTDGEYERWAE